MTRIKKISTYENIQLENLDGSRPRGSWARLQKTFTDANFDMRIEPGIGVRLKSKEDPQACVFVIPFANIPFVILEQDRDEDQDHQDPQAGSVRIRRRRRSGTDALPVQPAEELESSPEQW